ncbi:OsmC family protein [candidate division WOR-3 bacterium]|nr:OsmC family protein [candidate division WOR-3 bacterium]
MIKLTLNKGLQFIAEDEYNHKIIIDTAQNLGGFDQGFRPMDLLLVAQAGCMGMDIVYILKKKGGKIDKFEILIQGQRAREHPKRYKKIIVKFICEGDYERKDLLRSFELSRDKYCGVSATLKDCPELEFLI